jgi:hypothetical protein
MDEGRGDGNGEEDDDEDVQSIIPTSDSREEELDIDNNSASYHFPVFLAVGFILVTSHFFM